MKKTNLNKPIGKISKHQWGRVHHTNGILTAQTAVQYKIPPPRSEKAVKELGFYNSGTGKHQSNTVYSIQGCVPTITTITGGGTIQIKVLRKWKRIN